MYDDDEDEQTFETRALLKRLEPVWKREERIEKRWYNLRPEVIEKRKARIRRDEHKVEKDLRTIYRTTKVQDDTPHYHVVRVIDVHVADMGVQHFTDLPAVDGHVRWCQEVERHGGPQIDPGWLRVYLREHLAPHTEWSISPDVMEGAVVLSTRIILPGGVLEDLKTGKPIPPKPVHVDVPLDAFPWEERTFD